ncbi:thioredoxin domain-containing protein [Candidatus Micrarchaeota archaeon]|nr:thioredoxin domain-containing protein [Candidatus Micrarchaeota archaeon]
MKNDTVLLFGILGVAVLVAAAIFIFSPGKYDDLAKCLSGKGTKMYGAFWCTHCKEQKEMFGKSWQYVDYVECSTPDGLSQLDICKAANITSYPTWVFADGTRHSGPVTSEQLAVKAGCPLPV